MTALLSLLGLVGWRGAVCAAVGAVLAGGAVLPLARWAERQACAERIGRAIAQSEIDKMERDNALIDDALAARRRADRDGFGSGDGGLPDDGFRRD